MSFSDNWDFFEAWRFEECPELIRAVESGEIIFFSKKQSKILWSILISSDKKHLMEMDMGFFSKVEKNNVDFQNNKSADNIFEKFNEMISPSKFVFLFFSESYLCITPFSLLHKYWNEFFLPSDETTIVTTVGNDNFLFSYEESFFIAKK